MNYLEMRQAVKLLDKEWNLGKKEAGTTSDICAWIYLFEVLEESEHIIIRKDKRKIIGFCGYSKNSSNKHLFRKKLYRFIKNQLYKSRKIKDLSALKEYENNYDYLPKKLENYFDGEISILIVDKNYRGKNIGKELLLDIFELAKKANIKKLQILTDESCNWKFYESCGCEKVYETIVGNEEVNKIGSSTEKAFIYEKNLC